MHSGYLNFFLVVFPAIFTIVNPLGSLGPFLSMTSRDTVEKKLSTAKRACLLATVVLVVCALAGGFIFKFFGITLPALKIAGGCLLFLVGMDMVNARESRVRGTEEEREEGVLKDDIAVFPLAIPLLCGPGAMVTVFILVERAKTLPEHAIIYASIFATTLISFIMLKEASRLARYLGATGINVMSRIMGLILAAIAVQFILGGLTQAFKI
jgi:multiple antibiotic resistance protein